MIAFSLPVLAIGGVTDPTDQSSDTLNQKVDGKKHGYWIIFAHMRNMPDYAPDDVIEEGRYKMNRKDGKWKKYFPTGNLKSEIVYKNGKAVGDFITYYNNDDNTVEEQGNWMGKAYTDKFVRYHENGVVAQEKTFNENGKAEGPQKYFYENGQVELEFNASNGKNVGTATRYWPNGDVKEIITFDEEGNGSSSGEQERVNPPVILDSQKEENEAGEGIAAEGEENEAQKSGNGLIDGYHKTYNDNKDILMDGEFKNGKLYNGKHYIYDEYGLLEKIEVYKNGKYVGNGVVE
jgi:antitoxin component YwqK of YwqJK toxin-antitoxin module